MRGVVLTVLGVSVLAGCNRVDDSILFDGQAFRGQAKFVERADRRDFTATVSPVSASVEGAREAGRYEGIKYCIAEYGTSVIEWAIDRDTVTFSGSCKP